MVSQVESLAFIDLRNFRWLLIALAGPDLIHRSRRWRLLYPASAQHSFQTRLGFTWPKILLFDRIDQRRDQSKGLLSFLLHYHQAG